MKKNHRADDLSDLMVVMAHDLSNPITALATNLSLLDGTLALEPGSDEAEALSDMQMLCDVLRRLVSNMDLVAQREVTRQTQVSLLDLVVVAREATARLGRQAMAADVELCLLSVKSLGRLEAQCDRDLLMRAIDNLIAFAIERAGSQSMVTVKATQTDTELREPMIEVCYVPRAAIEPEVLPPDAPLVARRRHIQVTHGRGLCLHAAQRAASMLGGRVDIGRTTPAREGKAYARLCLIAPAPKAG